MKGHTVLYYFIFVLLLSACKTDVSPIGPIDVDGHHFTNHEFKNYLPSEYFSGLGVIFKNVTGFEKTWQIEIIDSIQELKYLNQNYTSEYLELVLSNQEDDYTLLIIGQTKIINNEIVPQIILIESLLGFTSPKVIIPFSNGIADTMSLHFEQEHTFNVWTYEDVFTSGSYGINKMQGVVAFEKIDLFGENKELWTFSKFEQ